MGGGLYTKPAAGKIGRPGAGTAPRGGFRPILAARLPPVRDPRPRAVLRGIERAPGRGVGGGPETPAPPAGRGFCIPVRGRWR